MALTLPVLLSCRIAVSIAASMEISRNYGERAAAELETLILREGADTVGAVILEPITAGGGVIEPPEGYWAGNSENLPKVRGPVDSRRSGMRYGSNRQMVWLSAL